MQEIFKKSENHWELVVGIIFVSMMALQYYLTHYESSPNIFTNEPKRFAAQPNNTPTPKSTSAEPASTPNFQNTDTIPPEAISSSTPMPVNEIAPFQSAPNLTPIPESQIVPDQQVLPSTPGPNSRHMELLIVKGFNEVNKTLLVGTKQAEILKFSIQAPKSEDIFVNQINFDWLPSLSKNVLANLKIIALPNESLGAYYDLGNISSGALGIGFAPNLISAGQSKIFSIMADVNAPITDTVQFKLVGFYFKNTRGDTQHQLTEILGTVLTLRSPY